MSNTPETPATAEQVYLAVEKYREEMGYKKLHVSLGPKATPENVVAELRKADSERAQYDAIPEIEKLKMQLDDAHEKIRELGKLAQSEVSNIVDGTQHPDVTELKHKIFNLTELYTAINISDHIERYYGEPT